MKKVALILLVALAAAGCCKCLRGASRSQIPVTGEPWRLVQMDGRTFEAEGDTFTIAFGEDGRLSGKGAANRITGSYTNDNANGTFAVSGLAATRMMSLKNQEEENRFVKLLQEADAYTIDGTFLMLLTKGERTLILERVQE